MLTMDNINTIKNLRNNHDKSINHIAKELTVNWRTAKKYADEEFVPEPRLRKKTGMMYVEKWGGIVALWLSEDAKLPKKKRRSAEAKIKGLNDWNTLLPKRNLILVRWKFAMKEPLRT